MSGTRRRFEFMWVLNLLGNLPASASAVGKTYFKAVYVPGIFSCVWVLMMQSSCINCFAFSLEAIDLIYTLKACCRLSPCCSLSVSQFVWVWSSMNFSASIWQSGLWNQFCKNEVVAIVHPSATELCAAQPQTLCLPSQESWGTEVPKKLHATISVSLQ